MKSWARKGYCERRQQMRPPSSSLRSTTGPCPLSGPLSPTPVRARSVHSKPQAALGRCHVLILIFRMLSTILRSRAPLRALHAASALRNHKWAQLTNILAGEIPPPVQVKSITPAGVLLQDGRLLPSACIFLEGEVLLWDVPPTPWKGWDESKFEVFDVVVPKPGTSVPSAGRLAFLEA